LELGISPPKLCISGLKLRISAAETPYLQLGAGYFSAEAPYLQFEAAYLSAEAPYL